MSVEEYEKQVNGDYEENRGRDRGGYLGQLFRQEVKIRTGCTNRKRERR